MSKARAVKPYNIFWCDTCGGLEVGGPEAIKKHLAEVHEVTDFRGTREMGMHLDGDTWFSWTYNWTVGGVKLHQETRQNRSRNDMMRMNAHD